MKRKRGPTSNVKQSRPRTKRVLIKKDPNLFQTILSVFTYTAAISTLFSDQYIAEDAIQLAIKSLNLTIGPD